MPSPPHSDVAERFQRFLKEVDLDREGFAAAVDGAISPHSLFSVLNGHRRPSRALAVLVERSWGFRADFLLDGKGEMWTQPAYGSSLIGGAVLSPLEAAVVGFMRDSVDNARAMDEQLEIAATWSNLTSRLHRLADELVACGEGGSDGDLCAYPLVASLLFEAVRRAADEHRQLTSLLQQLRVEKLLDPIVDRCLREIPASFPDAATHEPLAEALAALARRRSQLRAGLEEAAAEARKHLREADEPGEVAGLARERAEQLRQRRSQFARLAKLASKQDEAEARALAAEFESTRSDGQLVAEWLERVVRELSREAQAATPAPLVHSDRETPRERFSDLLQAFAA